MQYSPLPNGKVLTHALCGHPRTPSGRRACRAQLTRYVTPAGRDKTLREPRTLRLSHA
jgi:hypothetical protein